MEPRSSPNLAQNTELTRPNGYQRGHLSKDAWELGSSSYLSTASVVLYLCGSLQSEHIFKAMQFLVEKIHVKSLTINVLVKQEMKLDCRLCSEQKQCLCLVSALAWYLSTILLNDSKKYTST